MSTRSRWILLTLASLLGIGLTASLGFWQLGRASQKEALHQETLARGQLPTLLGTDLRTRSLPDILHRTVRLSGRWLGEATVFLDNRQMDGRPGFYVATPLELADGGGVLLVVRGWVPRNFLDRTALPSIDTPRGTVELEGRIAPPPAKLYDFSGQEHGPIRQNLDLGVFSLEVGRSLLPYSLQQTGADSSGLLRHWPIPVAGVEKHYGYAFQWFGLSALITILYVWFQIVRRYYPSKSTRTTG